jgi:2-thiouracil desulfurase
MLRGIVKAVEGQIPAPSRGGEAGVNSRPHVNHATKTPRHGFRLWESRPMNGDVSTTSPVRIGISACLLGEKVRFDGNHKRDAFLVEVFGRHVTWVPVCPEVEMGLGVPRKTMRLEQHGHEIRLVTPKTGADHTERLRPFIDVAEYL